MLKTRAESTAEKEREKSENVRTLVGPWLTTTPLTSKSRREGMINRSEDLKVEEPIFPTSLDLSSGL